MTRITGQIVIGAPADAVFDFVADQRNEPAYNPHMGLDFALNDADQVVMCSLCWLARERPG
jgi:hypothetical protein